MFYEAKIAFDNEGKSVKEQYIVEGEDLFGAIEARLYEEFGTFAKFEVMSIKKNLKMREFVNEKPECDETEESKIYYATIVDIFVDDNDKVHETPYVVAVFARSMAEAQRLIAEYMRQGMEDLKLKTVTETKFVDLLK